MSCVERIMVIGCPGSGKTKFALKLRRRVNLPIYSLDDYHWKKNWTRFQPKESNEWLNVVQKLADKKQWIIEGNYLESIPIRLKRADVVFYLDYPTLLCLWRSLKRFIKRFFGEKSSLPKVVREDNEYKHLFRIDWNFFKLILNFRRKQRPILLNLLKNCNAQVFRVLNPKQLNFSLDKVQFNNSEK